MFKIIHHAVTLPAPAEKLYDMYLDPKTHAAITDKPVTISPHPGSEFLVFDVFDGLVTGKILSVVPKCIIVQLWREKNWKPEVRDSLVVMTFSPEGDSGKIELIHVHVPEGEFDAINRGWQKYYWKPWREYLEKESGLRRAA